MLQYLAGAGVGRMIGVDTNVLARLFLEDDPKQTASARRFFAARSPTDPAFISAVVIAEFIWLLTSRYRYSTDAAQAASSSRSGGSACRKRSVWRRSTPKP